MNLFQHNIGREGKSLEHSDDHHDESITVLAATENLLVLNDPSRGGLCALAKVNHIATRVPDDVMGLLSGGEWSVEVAIKAVKMGLASVDSVRYTDDGVTLHRIIGEYENE